MNANASVTSENPPATQQYRRLWRWHFYAAFLVIPFIVWQGITGVIYLWHEDLANALWPQLRLVEARAENASLDQQLTAIRQNIGAAMPATLIVKADPRRSTQWVFDESNGLHSAAFVDPHTGKFLGSVSANTWLPGLTRELHGGWPLGKPGSWLLELGDGWCIVMVLTGLYLWWPRSRQGLAGVLYPRLRAGARIFWKDIHAVIGFWFSLIFLAFLFTALPWTDFWGNHLLKPIQRLTGQGVPAALGIDHAAMHMAMPDGMAMAPIALQDVLDTARREGLDGDLEIRLRSGDAPIQVTMKTARAADERTLQIDRFHGEVLARVGWNDYPAIPKLVATGVDLHEGTFFGTANRIFNTVVVAALLWLVVTGLIGWYRRRPGKGLSAPPPQLTRMPRWLKGVALGLCVFMPLLGASVLLLWLLDALVKLAVWQRA